MLWKSFAIAYLAVAQKWTVSTCETLHSYGEYALEVAASVVFFRPAVSGNALVTPLGLIVSMGGGDHLFSDGRLLVCLSTTTNDV
ncbi:hypothetical protein EVAR_6393_1 [Eumeta japonica]|uniref:Secreted protein n=1 Tax=Eumeta variegata TaxID=151549 RepID=A0A4C1TFM6_EUMVA|nr:hypothetical protein EVAR_6393_1 [Eumeta japonica]